MRTSGLSVFGGFVAILAFPFAARALITVGALDIPGVSESVVVVDGVAYVAGSARARSGACDRILASVRVRGFRAHVDRNKSVSSIVDWAPGAIPMRLGKRIL